MRIKKIIVLFATVLMLITSVSPKYVAFGRGETPAPDSSTSESSKNKETSSDTQAEK